MLVFCFVIVIGVSNSSAAKLIYCLDFESAGWESAFRSGAWSGKVDRVKNSPHSGSYCLRGNLKEGNNDPITGLPGENNPQLEFVGNNISPKTPKQIFIRYCRRLDQSNWSGTMNGHGKGEFITDDENSVRAYYTGLAWNSNDYCIASNGAYSQDEDRANWGYIKGYLAGPNPGGAGGVWHKFEIYADYRNPANQYLKMWVYGVLLTARPGSAAVGKIVDGKIKVDRSFHMRGLQLLYVASTQVNKSTNGKGFACGYQFDDIEVWDGMPGDEPDSKAIVIDNLDPAYSESGSWVTSNAIRSQTYGANYRHNNADSDTDSATFTPNFLSDGEYDVDLWWPAHPNRSTSVKVTVVHADGTSTTYIDQTKDGGKWNNIGSWKFNSGDSGHIVVGGTGSGGDVSYIIADAARFTPVSRNNEPEPEVSEDTSPSVNINAPTSDTRYSTTSGSIDLAGFASDDDGISSVTWSNNKGGGGTTNYNSGTCYCVWIQY